MPLTAFPRLRDLYSPSNPNALAQARGDLGIVTSRANTGGAHAVQWSLPG